MVRAILLASARVAIFFGLRANNPNSHVGLQPTDLYGPSRVKDFLEFGGLP